jgi:hypothetical protein
MRARDNDQNEAYRRMQQKNHTRKAEELLLTGSLTSPINLFLSQGWCRVARDFSFREYASQQTV